MVAFNFQAQFADAIASGEKRQTIREKKRGNIGDRVQLYTGQRTKACRKLVDPDPVIDLIGYVAIRPEYLTLHDTRQHPGDADAFARRDGFKDYAEMVKWFQERYGRREFVGFIHRWRQAETTD